MDKETEIFILTIHEKLKSYAINYHKNKNDQNNIEFNTTNIEYINDVEIKLNKQKEQIIDNIMQEHNYSKMLHL